MTCGVILAALGTLLAFGPDLFNIVNDWPRRGDERSWYHRMDERGILGGGCILLGIGVVVVLVVLAVAWLKQTAEGS